MQKRNNSKSKKIAAVSVIAPVALSSMMVPGVDGLTAHAATEVPTKISNATIDWDTFTHESISLFWDADPNAKGYVVERNGVEVYRGTQPRFDDTGLVSGATYQYAIYAYNDAGMSVPNIDYITTEEVYQSIVLNWLPVEGATGFRILRNGAQYAEVDADALSYTDTMALVGNKYRYKVVPIDGDGSIIEAGIGEWDEITPKYEDIFVTQPANRAPTSKAIGPIDVYVDESQTVDLDNYFSDPNNDVLNYTVTASNENIEVTSSGTNKQIMKVTGAEVGSANVLVTAKDGRGGTTQRQVAVNVLPGSSGSGETGTGNGGNIDPLENRNIEMRDIPTTQIELNSGKEIALDNYFNDPDGDEIRYTVSVNNERVSAAKANSKLQLEGLELGEAKVTITADDGHGHIRSQTFIVQVVEEGTLSGGGTGGTEVPEEPEDRLPIANNIPNVVIDKGQSKTITISDYVKDRDGDKLTYTYETNIAGIISTVESVGVYDTKLKITGDAVGQTKVTVTGTDSKGNKATTAFVVKVEEPFEVEPNPGGNTGDGTDLNQKPVGKTIPDGSITINTKKTIPLSAYFSDPDGDNLTYTVHLGNSNVGKSLNGSNLVLEGLRLGRTKVTVYASDGVNSPVPRTFYVTVTPAPLIPPYYDVQGVKYGADFMELEWYPIWGAAGYWVYLNDDLVFEQLEDGSDYYHYRAEGLDPNLENVLELVPYGSDGESLGSIVFPNLSDKLAKLDVKASVNADNLATVSWNPRGFEADVYKVVITNEAGEVVSSKEYNYQATQHTATIEKAGKYTASVSPKVNGEYVGAQAVDFNVEHDLETNHAPTEVANALGNSIRVTIGEAPYVKDLSQVFIDEDGDELTYTVDSSNTNASVVIEGTNLKVVGNLEGTTTIKLTAKDAAGEKITKTLLVYVDKPVNKAPIVKEAVPNVTMKITDVKTFDATSYFTDPEGETVVVSVGTLSNANVKVTSDGKNISITPQKVGKATVQLVATDSEGAKVTTTFEVTVEDVAPVAPENFTATATAHNEVQLAFDKVSNAKEYIIKRNGVEIGRTQTNSYTDKNLTAETAYEYEVIGSNDIGQGEAAKATVTTPEVPLVKDVQATVVDQDVTVTWSAFNDSTRYKVFRYVKNAAGEFVADNYGTTVTGTQFVDKGLKGDTEYKFKVVPFVQTKNDYVAEYAGEATAKTEVLNLAPVVSNAIPDQTFKVTDESKELNLADYFSDPNGDALTYEVKSVSRSFVSATVDGSKLTLTPNAVGDVEVTVKVTDPKGLSVESTFKVSVKEIVPLAVTNLSATALAHNKVEVKFDASAKATQYIIKRDGVEIGKVTEPVFIDTTAQAEKTYEYEVIASNASGKSDGVTATVTTPGLPMVKNVKAVLKDATTATISWDKYLDSTRYRVQAYVKDASGEFVKLGYQRSATSSSFTFSYGGLEPGNEYKFEVVPVNSSGVALDANSALSNVLTLAPLEDKQVEFDVTVDGLKANVNITPFTLNGVAAQSYRVTLFKLNVTTGEYERKNTPKSITTTTTELDVEAGGEYKVLVEPRLNNVYDADTATEKLVSVPASNGSGENGEIDEEIKPDEVTISGVRVTADGTKVHVEWDAIGSANTFKVYRYLKQADGTYKLDRSGTRVVDTKEYTDLTAAPNVDYLYVVVPLLNNRYPASKALGGEVKTGDKSTDDTTIYETVKNVVAVKSGTTANVTWDQFEDTGRYRIKAFEKLADGTFSSTAKATATAIGVTNTAVKNLAEGKTYKIVVQPLYGSGYSTVNAGSVEISM